MNTKRVWRTIRRLKHMPDGLHRVHIAQKLITQTMAAAEFGGLKAGRLVSAIAAQTKVYVGG